jgi:hypothetical protein
MAKVEFGEKSSLIGSIYDCALEPDLWPATLQRMCEAFELIAVLIHQHLLVNFADHGKTVREKCLVIEPFVSVNRRSAARRACPASPASQDGPASRRPSLGM